MCDQRNFSPSYKKLDLSNLPNNHVWQLSEAGKTTTTQTALLVKTGAQCERFWFGSAAGEAESWNAELGASAHGGTKPHAALWEHWPSATNPILECGAALHPFPRSK